MRKIYLTVLSLFGLAGSPVPAQAQVLKGSREAEAAKSSTVKSSKVAREEDAPSEGGNKHDKTGKHLAGVKLEKNTAERQAVKTQSGIKMRKGATMDASSKDAAKMTKSSAERNAAKINLQRKDVKSGAAQYPIEHGKEASGGTKADFVIKGNNHAAEQKAGQADAQIKMKKNSTAAGTEKTAPTQAPK